MAKHWEAVASQMQGNPVLELEALSYSLLFARLAEANTGGIEEKRALARALGVGINICERVGEADAAAHMRADAIALIDSAADAVGASDDGTISDEVRQIVDIFTAQDAELAGQLRGIYDVGK